MDTHEAMERRWWRRCWFRVPGWVPPQGFLLGASPTAPDVCKLAWDQTEPRDRARGDVGLCVPACEDHRDCPFLNHPNVRQIAGLGDRGSAVVVQ